jgi:hypothetical protein
VSRASSIRAFRAACDLLRTIDRKYEIYVASDRMHLMSGSSHDDRGKARRERIIDSDLGTPRVRISGGDW